MRKSERLKKKQLIIPKKKSQNDKKVAESQVQAPAKAKRGGWYDVHYKKLLIIPFLLLIASLIVIGLQYAQTGDFINKGVSLKGGVSITIPSENIDAEALAISLSSLYPTNDIESRNLEEAGKQIAVTINADIDTGDQTVVDAFIASIEKETSTQQKDFSIETIGASIGDAFFRQTLKALFMAFIFMGMVVFLYFGEGRDIKIMSSIATVLAGLFMFYGGMVLNIIAALMGLGLLVVYAKHSVPSIAVILAAFSDIVITLAVTNLLGIKLSTAGIAAFLMLIGYSVDTDILLSTRVLKRTGGSVYDRIINAVSTGLTMNFTTLAAVIIALIFAESAVITQIMTILLIGLFADMINTWFQNTGILRWHLELKAANSEAAVHSKPVRRKSFGGVRK